jgi:diacylglycerol kinase family enzyme
MVGPARVREALAPLPLRIALVANPRTLGGGRAGLLARASEALGASVVARLDTRGGGEDAPRIAQLLGGAGADLVVAAGGDGTVRMVVAGLLGLEHAARPTLAFLPFGTGNNVARSVGLRSIPREGGRPLDLALDAIRSGRRCEMDIGLVNDLPFVGSFSAGMDGDILALRNRLRRRLGSTGRAGGYPLYLLAFALGVVRGVHGGHARVSLDGSAEAREVYNLTVVNVPVYAGEFRFDAGNETGDGRLEVHAVSRVFEYVTEYPRAWRRHRRFQRGASVRESRLLRRVQELSAEFDQPVAAQVDGEELGRAAAYRVRVLPRAIRVCLPPLTRPAAGARSR